MQPEASPKPVMDVTPPRPVVPGTPAAPAPLPTAAPSAMPAPAPRPETAPMQQLTVHEPPASAGGPTPPAQHPDAAAKELAHHDARKPLPTLPAEKPAKAQPAKAGAHLQAPPLPVGAITATVIVMVVLIALTLVAYVASK